MADQEEDFSSLPLPDRFAHKNWKVRKEGYEAAAKEFDAAQTEADPIVRQFILDSSIWKSAVSDSNVAAHAEAINALCSFLQIGGTQATVRTRASTIAPLAEKGLISTKAATKQKAMEAVLLYVEMDKPDPVIDELIPILAHKLPKIIAATLTAFTAIIHTFGCATVDPKPILKTLPKVFGHADKNVRAEAQNLAVEAYRWLRDGMKPFFWNDLKPVQQTDLDALFAKVKDEPAPRPERLLKSQQAKAAAAAEVAQQTGEEEYDEDEGAEAEFEAPLLAINVFAKIPKDFSERLASTKWKDRKDALDELHTAVNVDAIEEGPFDDIMRGLAKSMKDANIAVVTVAANCIELLAKGLRKKFAKYRSTIFSPIMERLKERKQSVTDALAAALDAICSATSLGDCLEETLEFLKHKNPLIKLEATRFLVRALRDTRDAPALLETKTIAAESTKLLTDSQETQRNAGAEVLGTLWKIMGDRIMNPHLDGLDDIRKAKIREFMEAAEVKSKYKPKPAAPPPVKAAPAAPGKRPAAKKPAGAAGLKKPAAAPRPAAPVEDPPTPLQPKPTARPVSGVPKPGAPRSLRPPGASVAKKQIQPPSGAASPRRPVATPPLEEDPVPPPAPKTISRGLTGRQLTKPSTSSIGPTSAPEPVAPATPSRSTLPGLSSVERHELDELRSEVDRLRHMNETYRGEHLRLTSQVNELQNQNAQLIEDHTRDVLSIKAKETQLVRARGDAETAEQAVQSMQREVERMKRELSRLGRTNSSESVPRTASPAAVPADNFPETRGERSVSGQTRPRSLMLSPIRGAGEGKENFGARMSGFDKGRRLSPPVAVNPSSPIARNLGSFAGQRGSSREANVLSDSDATRVSDGSSGSSAAGGRPVSMSSATNGTGGGGGDGGGGDGNESWRRAAEVTSNLKARIELMKARQRQQQGA